MGSAESGSSDHRTRGREEMQELALGAITALEQAGLVEEMRSLRSRILDLSPEVLFEASQTPEGGWRWNFKPMVELALREIQDVAGNTSMSESERQRRI